MNALKEWRKARKLSAEDAGALIGVSRTQWFRMESGARAVALAQVLKLESITGISRRRLRPDVFADDKESAA